MGPYDFRDQINDITTSKIYLLVITDLYSRWCELTWLEGLTSLETCKKIEENWILKHGIPKIIISDQGRQLTSEIFQNLSKKYKIKHSLCSPHNSTGNGVTERINRSINEYLRGNKETHSLTTIKDEPNEED